ncbi:MAG TPA: flagellar motor protein MotB [Terracidiphilus sp.]|nr:flagellar motor protein MotB [Terracidiphilus sp.]
MPAAKAQPIIVIKKHGGHGGHHGGAWKVAYADFVTAMMALFIVLWLMSQSEEVKKAVAGYFQDPKGTASLLGTTMSGNGVAVTTHDEALEKLKERLEQEIKAKKELEKLSKQIEITITPEGLRIELLEGKDGTFYESGSARLSANGQELLALLAGELKTLPNDLLIEGHTDATQYSTDANYSNWELSADRANSARRLMQQDGVRSNQVTQVRGYADQLLRVKNNPYDPSNRRISILVKNSATGAPPQIKDATVVGGTGPSPAAKNSTQGGTKDATGSRAAHPVSGNQPAAQAQDATPPATIPKPSPSATANAPAAKSGFMSKLMGMLPVKKK